MGDVAGMCKLSKSAIYGLKEKIGYLRIGGAVRFRPEDVTRYLDECEVTEEPKREPRTRFRSRHFA